jgi:hypothetical protein
MEPIIAAVVCVSIVAFGELIAYVTKSAFPSMSVALITYLVLVWVGMPTVFPDDSGINTVGMFMVMIYLAYIGTTIAPREFARNWRSVLIAGGAVAVGTGTTVGIGGLLFGFGKILTGAGAALGGGAMSGIAAIDVLTEGGHPELIVLPVLMISSVDPLGQPICAFFLRKHMNRLIAKDAYLSDNLAVGGENIRLTKDGVPYGSEDNPSPFVRNFIPKSLESEPVLIAELALLALLSVFIESWTGINSLLLVFVLGIAGCTFGFLRLNVLDRALSSGIVLVFAIVWMMPGMNEITPQIFIEGLGPMLGIIILSAVGLGLGAGLVGKLFKYDFFQSVACGIAIMFIVPGCTIIPRTMSRRLGRDEKEVAYLHDKVAPNMYIIVYSGIVFGLTLTMLVFLPAAMNML